MKSGYEFMGEDMDAVTAPPYSEIGECYPPGGMIDPGFGEYAPPPPPVADNPDVLQALDQLQAAIETGPGGITDQGLFGVPWPWVAGGLLAILLLRR